MEEEDNDKVEAQEDDKEEEKNDKVDEDTHLQVGSLEDI